jgi:protoheme IX farnesyltransferase
MLPVVQGDAVTRRHIFVYSLALVTASLVLIPVNGMGWIYSAASIVLGLVFVYRAWQLLRAKDTNSAWRLYKYSITYLTFVFAAMVADTLLPVFG